MSDSRRTFPVGNTQKDLFFSEAVRIRLVGNYDTSQLGEYLISNDFYVLALGLLLVGKEATKMTMEDILDKLEEFELEDEQGAEIVAWVSQKVVNFMQKQLQTVQKQMESLIPQMIESNHTLTGLENALIPKSST